MALPDPYANEPTAEVDPGQYQRWLQARDAAAQWKREEERLRVELEAALGTAHAGTVNGEKVFTYRPIERWAESRLLREHPDLTAHYVKPTTVDTFDLRAFRTQHPDIADQYRSRQFRAAE